MMMDPLYIQEQSEQEDGIAVPLGFVTFSLVVLVLFAKLNCPQRDWPINPPLVVVAVLCTLSLHHRNSTT